MKNHASKSLNMPKTKKAYISHARLLIGHINIKINLYKRDNSKKHILFKKNHLIYLSNLLP